MRETYPAIIQGSISTMLSILPLLWHPIPFIRLYMCVPFLILTAVGMIQGMIILPGVLTLFVRIVNVLRKHDGDEAANDGGEDAEKIKDAEQLPTVLTSSAAREEAKSETQRV